MPSIIFYNCLLPEFLFVINILQQKTLGICFNGALRQLVLLSRFLIKDCLLQARFSEIKLLSMALFRLIQKFKNENTIYFLMYMTCTYKNDTIKQLLSFKTACSDTL